MEQELPAFYPRDLVSPPLIARYGRRSKISVTDPGGFDPGSEHFSFRMSDPT
jgi:hypothetical protein